MAETERRIPQLDGLRGLAILLVVTFHYMFVPYTKNEFPLNYVLRLFSLTWSGVDLFFVLSGFLIGGILLANRDSQNYFKTFYLRRLFRIIPLYAVWLLLFYLLQELLRPYVMPDVHKWLFHNDIPAWNYLTMTQNIWAGLYGFTSNWLGGTWSLAVEEQFYLILPLLIYICPPRRLVYVLGGLILIAPVLRFLSVAVLHLPLGDYVLLPCRMDALILGVLCAWALRQPQIHAWLRTQQRLLYALFGVFLLGTLPLMRSGLTTPFASAVGYFWMAAGYTCLLLIVVTGNGLLSRIFANRLLRALGTVAYGVYLFHPGINGLLHGFILGRVPSINDTPGVAITFLALIVTLLLAHFSWRFFERRFVEIGHQYRYQPTAETPAVQPAR